MVCGRLLRHYSVCESQYLDSNLKISVDFPLLVQCFTLFCCVLIMPPQCFVLFCLFVFLLMALKSTPISKKRWDSVQNEECSDL